MNRETKPYTFDEFNRKMEEMQALNDDGNFDHAFNMFETVDNGTVFIDCTSGYDGENDMGDCIAHIGNAMEGYTITSIDNPEESVTIEWEGTVYYEYFW